MEKNIISQEELKDFEKKIIKQISGFRTRKFKNPLLIINTGGTTSNRKVKTFINKFLNTLNEYQSFDTNYHLILATEKIENMEIFSENSRVEFKKYINSIKPQSTDYSLLNPIHFISTLNFKPDIVFIFNMSRNKDCLNDTKELRDDFLYISKKLVWILPEDYADEFTNLDPHIISQKKYIEISTESQWNKVDIFQRALTLATKAHKNQCRKGTTTPYIVHPVMVAMLLREEGCPEHLILSGLLHDTIEDSHITYEDINTKFGKKVAKIVLHLSDKDKSLPWETRKQCEIDFLKKDATPEEIIVACADKFHNISCISADYKQAGNHVWKRFNAPKEKQRWYYYELLNIFENNSETLESLSLYEKFKNKVYEVFPE
ncbi:HD domain-containing protein [Ilyobacter polytropus]|uniref:Metal dependent phosphohydrolase n=1 Tax=Ilyobacter polytropus (strain ATCC 51220 / DSM 2926 / LMG 16218 / CuHBu1) TaxID=572544 RepID=E3HBX4_ILYPC|nr:HD domain-containing protein [Ilyobacter polytropus]ADO84300.1 metal dependent phosphohydrolase [Ilyobacter polytropus DSM 2926]